jgi:hypothetical protein
VRLPLWAFQLTLGRFLPKGVAKVEEEEYEEKTQPLVADEDDSTEPGKATPSTGSAEDFELLEKSIDDLSGEAKATGSQKQGNKAGKRKNKKR